MYKLIINTRLGKYSVQCNSFEHCATIWKQHREAMADSLGIGASGMRKGCGDVYQGKTKVGWISYNGRINRLVEAA